MNYPQSFFRVFSRSHLPIFFLVKGDLFFFPTLFFPFGKRKKRREELSEKPKKLIKNPSTRLSILFHLN